MSQVLQETLCRSFTLTTLAPGTTVAKNLSGGGQVTYTKPKEAILSQIGARYLSPLMKHYNAVTVVENTRQLLATICHNKIGKTISH
jgi:hypothetical protein